MVDRPVGEAGGDCSVDGRAVYDAAGDWFGEEDPGGMVMREEAGPRVMCAVNTGVMVNGKDGRRGRVEGYIARTGRYRGNGEMRAKAADGMIRSRI